MILDLHVPKKDGFHVLTEMREGGNRTPVIILTGHYPDEVIAEKIQGLDVGEVLRKSVMITALMNAVNRLASGPG